MSFYLSTHDMHCQLSLRSLDSDKTVLKFCTRYSWLSNRLSRTKKGDAISFKEECVSKLFDGTAYRRLEDKKVSGWLDTAV